jgi:Uma2 family endonuclease
MNVAVQQTWTQERFFAWAQAQDVRYEFDGFRPVAMTGGTAAHSRVTRNLLVSLQSRLRGKGCEALGPDAGVETVDGTVRYPDALVTCSKVENGAYLVPGVVVVFEVASPSPRAIHTDRVIKVREYAAVPSIRRYVIVESEFVGLTVMERLGPDEPWTVSVLTIDGILGLPEIGIEVPVVEIYEDLDFSDPEDVPV